LVIKDNILIDLLLLHHFINFKKKEKKLLIKLSKLKIKIIK
jgi:hypothetical protein